MINKTVLTIVIITLLIIPTFIIITNGQSDYNGTYNHFEFLDSKDIPGLIGYFNINPNRDQYVIVTSNIEIIGKTNDLSEIIEFPYGQYRVSEWNSKGDCLATGNTIRCYPDYSPSIGLVGTAFSWSPNSDRLISIYGKQMTIWNTKDFSIIKEYNNTAYTSVAWSKDGNYFAAAISPLITIFNGTNYSIISEITVEKNKDSSVASKIIWNPDSKYIAYSSGESFIQIIDVINKTIPKKLYHFSSKITGIDWSHYGNYLAASSADGIINLFDMIDNEERYYSFDLLESPIGIKFIDDHTLLIASYQGTLSKYKFLENGLLADAGPEINDLIGITVTFDGSGSVGDIAADGYLWTINIGTNAFTFNGRKIGYIFSDPGNYSVELTVTDIYGNSSIDITYAHIFLPSARPNINFSYPQNNTDVSGVITITGTASDDISVRGVEIKIDDGNWILGKGNINWSYTIDTRIYENKEYFIHARAFDDTQYSEEIWMIIHFLNTEISPTDKPPSIIIFSPTNGQEVKGNITIIGSANDDTYVKAVNIYYPNVGYDAIGTKNWYSIWNSWAVPDGYYTIKALARDGSGQQTPTTVKIYVNNTGLKKNEPPIIKILSPSDNSIVNGSISISGVAHDDAKLLIVQIQINESLWLSCTGFESWTYLLNTTRYKNQTYLIRARAFDGKLFSETSSIHVAISNPKNRTNNDNPIHTTPTPTSVDNYSFCILFILIFSIIISCYFWSKIKKYNIYFSMLIIVLLLLTYFSVSVHVDNYKNNNNQYYPPNSSNNTTYNDIDYAPDFTSVSLRTGKLNTNENLLGNITVIYFYYANTGTHRTFNDINSIYSYYKDNKITNVKIISFNCYLNISNDFFNKSLIENNRNVGWEYSIDRNGIQNNFPVTKGDSSWVIIDKDGVMRKWAMASEYSIQYLESEIDKILNEK